MKQKIKSALEQEYKVRLGLSEDAFERVATLGGTFITSDEQIATFVKGAESILKAEQSAADKVRTELNAKIKSLEGEKAELEAKLKNGNPTDPKPEPPKPAVPQEDFKAMFAEALAEVVNPLKEELATFKAAEASKSALSAAEATFKSNDYVKKYGEEATDAWERATEMYEATGKTWTASELGEKAMGYFNNLVKRKGVDTTKPFESDGGGKDDATKASEITSLLKKSGRVAENK